MYAFGPLCGRLLQRAPGFADAIQRSAAHFPGDVTSGADSIGHGGSLTRLQRSGNPGSHRLASALTNNHEVCMTAGFSAVRCSAVALACLDGQAAANAAEAVALEMPRTRQQLGD